MTDTVASGASQCFKGKKGLVLQPQLLLNNKLPP